MKKKRIGVVADDITGANDIGALLAKKGFAATVVSLENDPQPEDFLDADALIINTGSRLDAPAEAARKSGQAASLLRGCGCDMLYTKTCSVFRGNIGASFDAVQDVAGAACSMVVAGFPRNGRTTMAGIHYVNGVPVGESAFARDPVTPVRCSRLADIIGLQSHRPCAEFPWQWLEEDEAAQRERLARLKREAAYVIFDVRHQEDLRAVARLIREERNICGSSAVCEELPEAWGQMEAPRVFGAGEPSGTGILIMAGSLTPQTAAQIDELMARKTPCLTMDPTLLLEAASRVSQIEATADAAARLMLTGQDVLVFAARETEGVRAASGRLGLSEVEAGRRISLAFEGIARTVRARTGARRYVVAGGETSDAVSRGLGVRTMRIWQEIEAGVPLMTAPVPGDELRLVFKSGSFGSRAFLSKAVACLQGTTR